MCWPFVSNGSKETVAHTPGFTDSTVSTASDSNVCFNSYWFYRLLFFAVSSTATVSTTAGSTIPTASKPAAVFLVFGSVVFVSLIESDYRSNLRSEERQILSMSLLSGSIFHQTLLWTFEVVLQTPFCSHPCNQTLLQMKLQIDIRLFMEK